MKIAGWQHFALARRHPTLTRLCLALGTVPVTARVVGDGLLAASRTSIEVSTQSCRAAVLDGAKGLQLLIAEAGSVLVEKMAALCAEDVGHLHGGPAHSFLR